MDEQNKIGNNDSGESGIIDNSEFVLSQVSPDIENRSMMDVSSLIEAALVSNIPLVKKIDLWGQAIFAAFRLDPIPAEIEQWVSQGFSLARQQVVERLYQLNLDEELTRTPLEAIVTVYQTGSPLYKKHNLEAFRVSQVYFYNFLFDTKKAPTDLVVEEKAYTFCIGVQVVGFANIVENHVESLTMCNTLRKIYEEIESSGWWGSQPVEMKRQLNIGIFLTGFNATKAAAKIGRFEEALDWSIRTEPFVSSINDAWMKSDYFARRGGVLIKLGQADEALSWLQKALAVPGLTPQEVNDTKKVVEFARAEITGEFETLYRALLTGVVENEDIEAMAKIIEAAETGEVKTENISKANEIMERYLSEESLNEISQDTSLPGMKEELERVRELYTVKSARAAMETGDLAKVERLLPGIRQMAGSDLPDQFRLDAAFFLVRFRQYKGETVTWQSISPMVSRLFQIPGEEILGFLQDVAAILLYSDEQELLRASAVIATLVKRVNFDDENEITLNAVVQQTAFSMDSIDTFLTLLAAMSECGSPDTRWWLEQVSRLKYRSAYRGQRLQKRAELFRYTAELSKESIRRIEELAESLAFHNLELILIDVGKTERQKKEVELMRLLYPLYSRHRSPQSCKESAPLYPEIIHIETANFFKKDNRESPVISIRFTGSGWSIDCPEVEIERSFAEEYLEFLEHSKFKKEGVKTGMKLREALLPALSESDLPALTGVRSTGIYHSIPLDSLPLSVDEETGEVKQWVGEHMVSALLTGENRDLDILKKPLSINNIAVFANSSFGGILNGLNLQGVVKEVEVISKIFGASGCDTAPLSPDSKKAAVNLFLESESNRKNFLRLSGQKAPRILHIATHGFTHEEYPSCSCIVLAGEGSNGKPGLGIVGYHDIMLMDLRQCDLVVLSACSTHEGKSILGEGIMGLAWAFKAAGVKAVIGTKWKVNDKVGVEFWGSFYENLSWGMTIGKAFHGARLHIMKQEKWRHPSYWGVFQLIV